MRWEIQKLVVVHNRVCDLGEVIQRGFVEDVLDESEAFHAKGSTLVGRQEYPIGCYLPMFLSLSVSLDFHDLFYDPYFADQSIVQLQDNSATRSRWRLDSCWFSKLPDFSYLYSCYRASEVVAAVF